MLSIIRTTTIALLCSLFSITAFSQSDAWACTGLTSIPVGTSCTNTTGGIFGFAVGTPTATCGTAYDGWYTFTVPSDGTAVSFDLSSSGGGSNLSSSNCYMQVFSASSCVLGSPIGSCTAMGTTLDLTGLTPSGVYYIRVFSTTNPSSGPSNKWQFKLCATYIPPPTNDDCSGATTLTSGNTNNSGSVWNATSSGVTAGCSGNPDDDVWYKITATGTSFTASITGTGLASNSPRMELFSSSGTCASIASLACGTTSISTTVTSGNVYYIRVYSNATGALASSTASAFSITATTVVPPTPPGNDDCANAYSLPIGTVCLDSRGTLTGATTSASIPIGTCTGTPDDDVWYKFVAQKSNPTITLSSLPTAITTTGGGAVLQLLSGTDCATLTAVACTSNTSTTLAYTASGLTIGATYYVRVFSKNAVALTGATFDICVTMPTPEVVVDSTSALFNIDIVGQKLGYPWEITYGPDDSLWITEARGYRVLRMSSSRSAADVATLPQQLLKIPLGSTQVTFDRTVGTWPQGGMQGLAIHPEFATDPAKQWVYLSYVYSGTCPASASSPCIFKTKIVRCQFYYATDAGNPSFPKKDTLIILDTIMSNLSGSNDHNSGRLKIGPVKEGTGTPTYKLYYTIGDMGAGQFNNTTRTNYALTPDTLEGKVLRLNTEPDGDGVPGSPTHDFDKYRQWIPNDNPFTHSILTSLRTPVYSYGHRNPQGLAWGNINGTWRLYSSEHGDRSDDEVNIIESGANYGWPKITGRADDNYNTADDAGDGFTMNNILANGTVTDEKSYAAAHSNYKDPLFDFLNWSAAQIETINTGNIFTWPTIAPSSIEFYNSSQIPGWKNSLLVTSLKFGMFRLKLNAAGDAIDSTLCTNAVDTFPLFHGWRVRDIAVSPNGGYIWAVIDSSGSTSGPTGGFGGANVNTKDGGRVIRLSFKNMSTLPVHFISFSGRLLTDKTVRLFWEATTDASHSYFDVERSTDNVNFISLGHVTGGAPYNFIDYTPNIGNNYYRIRQVNSDGVSKYSRVINVPYEPYSFIVSAYPNPIQDQLTIRISAPGRDNVNVTVTDVSGRTVYSSQNIVDRNVTTLTIDTKAWASQMYLLKCTNQDNKVVSVQKVMKQ